MGRDHLKLNVFHKADELVLLVYRYSRGFPADGLRSQLRRAVLDIALGSTAETDYLLHVATKLDYLQIPESENCRTLALEVRKMLQKLIAALRSLSD